MKIMALKKERIFKMKKIFLLFVLFLSLIGLVACNETVPNDGSVKLDITDAYKQYIKYDDIPSFTLNFDGNLNTIANVNKSYYTVFSSNDDIILSDALSELFEICAVTLSGNPQNH